MELNCDLGEGEPRTRTRALMRWVASANVACGGHAGELRSMLRCVALAKEHGVNLGAHPGFADRTNFGRGTIGISADAMELLLLQQVGALRSVAREAGVRLHHIKLHGALYHAVEEREELAQRYLECARRFWPGVILFVKAGGRVAKLAAGSGVRIWGEAFLDRAYNDDGSLVSRGAAGGLITEPRAVLDRVRLLCENDEVETIAGRRLRVRARTVCLHSDSDRVVQLARCVAEWLASGRRRRRGRGNP
jgi:UPF0271 protein